MKKIAWFLSLVLGLALLAMPGPRAAAAEDFLAPAGAIGEIDVQADSLEYKADRKTLVAQGNVVISRGGDTLKADYIEVNTQTQEARARGNVSFEREGKSWRGQEVVYNFKTRTGDFGGFEAYTDPFHVRAEDSERVSENEFVLHGVMITTCDPDRPGYAIKAGEARLTDGRILRARNVVFYLGPVPFFYLPYMKKDLQSKSHFQIVPGASSRMGPYLLTAYVYDWNEYLSTATRLDYRTKRGVGVGQDVMWEDPVNNDFKGKASVYYANDQKPYADDEEEQERKDVVSKDRYWLHLSDMHNLTDRDYVVTEINYLSDPYMLEEFFDDDYQENVQPENRITLTHRGDQFTAGLTLNKRLNDFYENVDRLPEAFLNINRQQIFDTPFYYESQNTASRLEKLFPKIGDKEARDSYDAFRVDTKHMIYYPTRHFGFLNIIPRGGYRGTYYSKTISSQVLTNQISVMDTNGVVIGFTNQVEETITEDSAKLRNLPELGLETSFKAFKELYNGPTGLGEDKGFRHVFEPYANYTYIPEPNVLPENLLQFDEVDTLGRRNDILLGMRNKLQTKRRNQVHDLIFFDIYSYLRLRPEENENDFSDVFFKTELRPVDWFKWDFDGSYDPYESEAKTFNTQVEWKHEDIFRVSTEYRYAKDANNQLAGEVELFPGYRWSGRVYGRYDLEGKQVEEHSYYLEHLTDCLGTGLGLRVRPHENEDDEYQVWFRLWVLAFPDSAIKLGR